MQSCSKASLPVLDALYGLNGRMAVYLTLSLASFLKLVLYCFTCRTGIDLRSFGQRTDNLQRAFSLEVRFIGHHLSLGGGKALVFFSGLKPDNGATERHHDDDDDDDGISGLRIM